MKHVLIVGSGISGMACALACAERNIQVTLASPFPSERSQSVMAAGGINAVLRDCEDGDSVASHVEDTLRGGCWLGGEKAVTGLCSQGEEILRRLERLGTVFSVDEQGHLLRRAFGGQSHRRTCYCGASTGKQIVSALVMEVRRFEALGLIRRRLWCCFHSALIRDDICYGAMLFDEAQGGLEAVYADAVVIATGGQNTLFGKTTGSTQCDGYAAGKLFTQGVKLKNLEFIQFHPTTLETPLKRIMISEAARGEGGRLFCIENGRKRWFMEEKYGSGGNLMTRDIVSREIESRGGRAFLDLSLLGKDVIDARIPEVRDICTKYAGIDISRDPIPVEPSVHFFMGGLAVHLNHETNIRNLFAVGECASMYHGANRLGGNSLLAAVYSGRLAAEAIAARENPGSAHPDFSGELEREKQLLARQRESRSQFPVMYIRDLLAESMRKHMGITRNEAGISQGLEDIEYYLSIAGQLRYDSSVMPYFNYSLTAILVLARAAVSCALFRRESRGAHFREDFPETDSAFRSATLIDYDDGKYRISLDEERNYES